MSPAQFDFARLTSVREVLSNHQFASIWSGQLESQFGDGIISVALPLLVLAITKNAHDRGRPGVDPGTLGSRETFELLRGVGLVA
jgi:hypothetical protein